VPKACQDDQMDYETELVVVIGKDARDVSEADAADYVLGYVYMLLFYMFALYAECGRRWQVHGWKRCQCAKEPAGYEPVVLRKGTRQLLSDR
jgi:hypothetical protein